MSKKLQAQGGRGGDVWDDGAFDCVRTVCVGEGKSCVGYVKFEYDKGGKLETREHGKKLQEPKEFVLDYPDEYIVSVEGTYHMNHAYGNYMVMSLAFKTSRQRTSLTFGTAVGSRFVLEDRGRKLVGFHGRAGDALDALGAYFVPVSWTSSPEKLEAEGGRGGDTWDDGTYYDVRKVYVGKGKSCVGYVKFEYDMGGKLETRDTTRTGRDYPDEYITAVEGTYDMNQAYGNRMITSLTFKTSKQRTSPIFGTMSGTKFVLGGKGHKLVGFHGRSGDALDALGAYFVPISITPPPKKLEAQGGSGGDSWDDGTYDGVRKLFVGQGKSCIGYVKFEYEKGGILETHQHGKKLQEPQEFVLNYPDECIISVEGTYDMNYAYGNRMITSLSFKTSKGKTSPTFGVLVGTKFVLEERGCKLVGFHGRAGDALDALGAYFAPLAPAKKLQAQGGDGGASWDDGVYDAVRKIYVGQSEIGVAFLKFDYDKGPQTKVGDGHGQMTLLGAEEFELDYPDEYITSVEGNYDKIFGSEAEVITMLKFNTNKRTSPRFGLEGGTTFVLEEKDSKIVGFHGKASNVVHQVGVHVVPINK